MRGRKIGIVALLVLGTLLCTGFGLGLWAKRQLLDTDNCVDTSGRLLEDEEIRAALGTFIADRVYTSAQVEQRAREILPDRLKPLAGPRPRGSRRSRFATPLACSAPRSPWTPGAKRTARRTTRCSPT
jgi:hypothetical protein